MPIQSHTLEQTTQANGMTHNVLRMFDQDGIESISSFYAAPEAVASIVQKLVSLADTQLADQEFNDIVGAE